MDEFNDNIGVPAASGALVRDALALDSAASSPATINERMAPVVFVAREILAEEGLEGLTIRAVLTRTGLARRAFYDLFKGKDELVLAIFELTLHQAAYYYRQQIQQLATPMERLRYIVTSIVIGQSADDAAIWARHNRRAAALSREHLRLAESRPAELVAKIAPLIQLILEQLDAGMAAGEIRKAPAQRMAGLVYNLVSTTVHSELMAPQHSAMEDLNYRKNLAGEIWEFCHRAIAA